MSQDCSTGMLTFTLKKVATNGVRLGEIALGSFKASTPSVFVNTSRLAVPHTTLDRFRKIAIPEGQESSRIAGVQVYADKLYENPKLVACEDLPNVHKFAVLQDFPVIMALESASEPFDDKKKNGAGFITVHNTS